MQSSVIKKIVQNGFWLSVLIHLLLLLSILTLMTSTPEQENKHSLPHYFVPAYTYTGSIKPSAAVQKNQRNIQGEKRESAENTEKMQSVEHTESRVSVAKALNKIPTKRIHRQKSFLSASFDMLKDEQMREVSQKTEADPIYMIGDDSQPADPLIKLLGRSLSAHFGYPRTAGELGIRGRVIIGLTLHPEGHYSNVQMLQSSNSPDLDAAALYAVNSAPRIEGADRFIDKPKHFVIGFVFN